MKKIYFHPCSISSKELEDYKIEKEVLLKEIHHRVKNNMSVISSLFELQLTRTGNPEAREVLRASQLRIQAMAMVYDQLYDNGDLKNIDMQNFVESLARNVSESTWNASKDIRVSTEIDNVNLNLDQLVPLGLILNELLTNSYKYAFHGRDKGEIRVKMKLREGNIALVFSDSGTGLPDGFDYKRGDTLGFKLLMVLTKQLQGKLYVNNGKGLTVKITFTA